MRTASAPFSSALRGDERNQKAQEQSTDGGADHLFPSEHRSLVAHMAMMRLRVLAFVVRTVRHAVVVRNGMAAGFAQNWRHAEEGYPGTGAQAPQ